MSNESIERLEISATGAYGIVPVPHGEYVRYSDHERIVKELEARIQHLTEWRDGLMATAVASSEQNAAQPSVADVVNAVEKMRAEYEQERKRRVDLYLDGDLYQDGRVKAAEEIVTAIKSLGTLREESL